MNIPEEHPYFQLTSKQQRRFKYKLALSALILVLLSGILSFLSHLYFLPFLVLPFLLSVIAPFFDVPPMVRSGKLRYYSLLVLAEAPRKGRIQLHGGTLFDYYFMFKDEREHAPFTRFTLYHYLNGLVNLIETHQDQEGGLILQGTTYMVGARTLEKIGFRRTSVPVFQRLILLFNYFNLTLAYSLVKGKLQQGQLSFPNFTQIYAFEASIEELAERREYIIALRDRIGKE